MLGSTYEAPELAIIAAVFLLAGIVKGVVGLGLPTVAIGLLAALIGLSEGMVLMVIPSLVTNLWQALAGGALVTIVRRVWGLLLTIFVGAWIGVNIFGRSDAVLLTAFLGILLCAYAMFGLTSPKLPSPGRHGRLAVASPRHHQWHRDRVDRHILYSRPAVSANAGVPA